MLKAGRPVAECTQQVVRDSVTDAVRVATLTSSDYLRIAWEGQYPRAH